MERTQARYAVLFREGGGPLAAGALELSGGRLLLAGRVQEQVYELSVAFADVVEIRIGRLPADRLNGSSTVVLERRGMPTVRVAPLGAGLLHEIADLLTALTPEQADRSDELAVIVPLRRGCLDRAKKLLESGPPLDPAALGLTGHEVYLREGEAIFVFRGPNVAVRLGRAARNPTLWRAGIAWQDCIAGRPQIAKATVALSPEETPIYRWTATDTPAFLTA